MSLKSTSVPVLIQLSKRTFLFTYWWRHSSDKTNKPSDNSKYTMAWLNKSIPAGKHVSDQHFFFAKFHCVALFFFCFFYLITGALERSTFSSGHWLKGFLLLGGTNYDRAWLYDLKLAASSNTVSEKWRQQRFNSRFALHFEGRFTPRQTKNKNDNHRFLWPSRLSTLLTSGMQFLITRESKLSKSISRCQDLPGLQT